MRPVIKTSLKDIIKNVEQILPVIKPFSLKPLRINYSDIFTHTLFIEFEKNKYSVKLYQKFREKLLRYSDYNFNPHLSLIYKNNMTVAEKKKIKKSISLPNSIKFDQLLDLLRN